MKLYIFEYTNYSTPNLKVKEVEVEEKNKVYVTEDYIYRRINKSEIGTAIGSGKTCILLEEDYNKAVDILIKEKEMNLKTLQKKIKGINEEINFLKTYKSKEQKQKVDDIEIEDMELE